MFIFLILTSSIFTAIGSYLDKYLVNLGISRDDYFYYMSFSLVPFAFIMMGIEYYSHALKFSLNIIPIVLLLVAMILRYYKQHTIVGYLKYLTPYEASAYLTLGLVLAFFIDVVIGTEEFTVFSVISVFITVFGVFLLADTKLKLKDLRKDLLLRIFTSLLLGYVTYFILQYWSNAFFMFIMNLLLTILFSKGYNISYHKRHKKIIFWVFIQQFFGFLALYFSNFLAATSVTLSSYVKPVSIVLVLLLAFFMKKGEIKPSLKQVLAIVMIAGGVFLINC